MKKIIISLPNHDDTTRYLSEQSKLLIRKIEETGRAKFTPVEGDEFVKTIFESRLKSTNFDFIFLNSHGLFDSIIGNDGNFVVKAGQNEAIFKEKIVYARSCACASKLGKLAVEKGCTAFIGYNNFYMFLFDPNYMAKPEKDELARPFFETTNLIPESIIKGSSVGEALEKSRNKYEKEIARFETQNTPEAPTIVALLKYNLKIQTALGNTNAKI